MRLFEVEDRFASDLGTALRNMAGRSNTDKIESTLTLPFPALNNLLKNMGYGPVEPDSLQKLVDGNPDLEKIIQTPIDPKATEVVIKTDTPNNDAPPPEAQNAEPKSVDSMASRAASRPPAI